MAVATCGVYRITGRKSGRTYDIRRDGVVRNLQWAVRGPVGEWYSQFASLPHARRWALEH